VDNRWGLRKEVVRTSDEEDTTRISSKGVDFVVGATVLPSSHFDLHCCHVFGSGRYTRTHYAVDSAPRGLNSRFSWN
jgi:hypothetical protein